MHGTITLRKKTAVLLLVMVLFGSTGDILLSKGMKQFGAINVTSAHSLAAGFVYTITNGTIWLGIGCWFFYFVCYLLVLSWADYSFVLPVLASGYVTVALLGHFVLHEAVPPARWVGIAIICLGVALVGRTPPRTTQPS